MTKKSLLLHACCAPCASGILQALTQDYKVSIFFCNPNIQPLTEYQKRLAQFSLIKNSFPFDLIIAEESFNSWENSIENYKQDQEGGKRCLECYSYRLRKTAELCANRKYDLFATTLTISPRKDHNIINLIGSNIAEQYKVSYLPSNFKKNNGFQRSVEVSRQLGLYRQTYCGCLYGPKA